MHAESFLWYLPFCSSEQEAQGTRQRRRAAAGIRGVIRVSLLARPSGRRWDSLSGSAAHHRTQRMRTLPPPPPLPASAVFPPSLARPCRVHLPLANLSTCRRGQRRRKRLSTTQPDMRYLRPPNMLLHCLLAPLNLAGRRRRRRWLWTTRRCCRSRRGCWPARRSGTSTRTGRC